MGTVGQRAACTSRGRENRRWNSAILTQTLETMPMSTIPQSVPSPATNVSLPTQNQLHHRHIDRRLLPEFLRLLASATTIPVEERTQDEQYQWLEGLIDPNSSLERESLRFLRDSRYTVARQCPEPPGPRSACPARLLLQPGKPPRCFASSWTDLITMDLGSNTRTRRSAHS